MAAFIVGLIMAVVGLIALVSIIGWIGFMAAQKKFWQGTAFLASAAAIFMFFGLLMAGDGLYKMGQSNPRQPSAITASVAK